MGTSFFFQEVEGAGKKGKRQSGRRRHRMRYWTSGLLRVWTPARGARLGRRGLPARASVRAIWWLTLSALH